MSSWDKGGGKSGDETQECDEWNESKKGRNDGSRMTSKDRRHFNFLRHTGIVFSCSVVPQSYVN